MFIFILIGYIFIYKLIKSKERSDKIFYTFYLFVMSIIILPFLKFFDNIIIYSIFLFIYILLLYSIYTDFEAFSQLKEILLKRKKVNKKDLQKMDYYLLDLLYWVYKDLINTYNIRVYKTNEVIIDVIFILTWLFLIVFACIWYFIFVK